jgi:hypothetical protein
VRTVLRFSADDAPLGRPQIVGTLTDGSVVVLEAAGPNIVLFSRAGRPLRTIGRRGRGPGEFLTVGGTGVVSDGMRGGAQPFAPPAKATSKFWTTTSTPTRSSK